MPLAAPMRMEAVKTGAPLSKYRQGKTVTANAVAATAKMCKLSKRPRFVAFRSFAVVSWDAMVATTGYVNRVSRKYRQQARN